MDLTDLTGAEFSRAVICVHEAGHAVMAVLAGARISECVASGAGGHVEFYDHDPERAAGIGWAGPFAELMFIHGEHPPEDAVREAFAEASPDDRGHMDDRRYREAEPDIRFAMPAIRRLASRLYRTGSARNLNVQAALGVRAGVDLDTVRRLHRQRIDPFTITPAGQWRAA